jgi:nucleoside-diphosphate-sugar epimerase
MRIVVTGGSGKAGRWVVGDLRERGHDVLNVDWRHDGGHGQTLVTDLTDLGQCSDALSGADAVVHLAAIPAPGLRPEGETFRINTLSTYNVFASAVAHRVRRVVWASSETVLGLPFDPEPPAFAPIDESHPPRPESSYALSKLVGEQMAAQAARRSGIPFVGLRISNIMEPDDYAAFPSYWEDARLRRWNLWGYVDVRDVAGAIWAGLEAPIDGAEVCIVAAADTVMTRPSGELMAEIYPTVPLRRAVEGDETLLAIDRAREVLGYRPEHRWRDHVKPLAG